MVRTGGDRGEAGAVDSGDGADPAAAAAVLMVARSAGGVLSDRGTGREEGGAGRQRAGAQCV